MFIKEQQTKFYQKNQYLFAGITTNDKSLKTTFNIFNMNTELDLLVRIEWFINGFYEEWSAII